MTQTAQNELDNLLLPFIESARRMVARFDAMAHGDAELSEFAEAFARHEIESVKLETIELPDDFHDEVAAALDRVSEATVIHVDADSVVCTNTPGNLLPPSAS